VVIFLSKYYKVIVHVIVWGVLFALQVNYLSSIKGLSTAFERGIFVFMLYLFIFYINWFTLIPRFYIKRKYLSFFLICTAILISTSFLRFGIEKYYNILPAMVQRPSVPNRVLRPYGFPFIANLFVFGVSFFLKIADFYAIQTQQKDQLLQQKTEAELKLLKAQLNPHFLFNALNNIYALVLSRSENAAGSLMSLSQLLRYIIYDAAAENVTLEKEITYLKYYIELESLRLTNKDNLKLGILVKQNNFTIMPLIFIPFVENSFKHSDINKKGRINIQISLNRNELKFICENTFAETVKNVDNVGGIGLMNIKKRLEMIYPQRHVLELTKKDNIFKTTLKIIL
jgi:two-component system LytT family sensor kinase